MRKKYFECIFDTALSSFSRDNSIVLFVLEVFGWQHGIQVFVVYSIMIIVFKRLIKSSVVDLIANLALTDNKQNIAGSFLKEQG